MVATKATAIPLPTSSILSRCCITWINPRTAPMMPMVGENPPAASNTCGIFSSCSSMLSSASSMILRSSCGSVPSTASIMERRRNGSWMLPNSPSSETMPSRRARLAYCTTIEILVQYANRARREGIVSLDGELGNIQEPFLRRSMMLAVDGTEPQELRKIMELALDNMEEQEEKIPQVFEAAGGFSPTIGIIGAVLGLIQVMQHLDKIDEVGKGIAVAFVATIYGVGAANLFFLPTAGKLKIQLRDEHIIRELTLGRLVSILEGMNPRILEEKLLGFQAEAEERAPAEQHVTPV